jgi:F0F1-type ATP synthase epsilon subunit
MSLQVCIMAPDRVFWNEEATEIILPTNTADTHLLSMKDSNRNASMVPAWAQ